MTEEYITVRNTLNGQVTQVRPNVMRNPHLSKVLVVVPEDAKPQVLIKPATAEEYISRKQKKSTKTLSTEADDTTEEG